MRAITVDDVAELMTELRAKGRSEKTIAGVLATLQSVVRFAIRNGWIVENPVEKLEAGEHRARSAAASGYSAARRSVACSRPVRRGIGR
jgi:site-specific recombinase XerD